MQVTIGDANGHEYVDLGLPSGTLWATMNVGASSETDYGNYYQYGKGADDYQVTSGQSGYSGTEDPLDLSVDTARQVWGGSWHMPTRAQMQELIDNTTYQWVTDYQGSGINGSTFTATNGAVLFIPAGGSWDEGSQYDVGIDGYYWGSSSKSSGYVYYLHFNNGSKDVSDAGREMGFSVRPVLNASKSPKYATKAELANVATSGSYNDLSDKPTIGAFIIETTYAELVAAKNGGTLAKGAWYRITDYVTTTAQSNTQSAGHAFDIIVRADSESVLNENAFAIQHAGDTYFANKKLSAWELKYDINNDTTKYAWADATNGKGVVYYMKDENDNECPYDFKNIQFKVGAKTQAGTVADVFYFTFSVATGTNDATVTDHSLNSGFCYSNKIGLKILSNKRKLSTNVFRNTSATSECYNNTFGNNCQYNTFGNNCQYNTFGNFSDYNTFGNNCQYNTFGNYCYNNTFGNYCSGNTFGNYYGNNTFGNYCGNNTFGNNCNYNTFGNNCQYNTFGNYCSGNTFGTASAEKDYYQNIIFENGVQYILLDCTQTTSGSAYCQNVLVGVGIKGTSSSKKTLTVATAGNAFKTTFKTANDVDVTA